MIEKLANNAKVSSSGHVIRFSTDSRSVTFILDRIEVHDDKMGTRQMKTEDVFRAFIANILNLGDRATTFVMKNAFKKLLRATIAKQVSVAYPSSHIKSLCNSLKGLKKIELLVVPAYNSVVIYFPTLFGEQQGVFVLRINYREVAEGMFNYPASLEKGRNVYFIKTYEPARFISPIQLSYKEIGLGLTVREGYRVII